MSDRLSNTASLAFFWPEEILITGTLIVILVGLVRRRPSRLVAGGIALSTCLLALAAMATSSDGGAHGLFGGLIARDPFSDFFKTLFLIATAAVGVLALRSRDAIDYEDGDRDAYEFYALMLAAALAMSLMAAATDLLMAYLSLEFLSILSYILTGFTRGSRRSAEASLKYVIYGGVASGAMLFGMSLLYGIAASTDLVVIQAAAAQAPPLLVICAVALCLAGFGFKVAVVPFHMWCPDVYEGAPTPVAAFISVGASAAGFALLLRFFPEAGGPETGGGHGLLGFARSHLTLFLVMVSAATMTLGNMAALAQSNLKRLLAYSSIAHAGYMMMAVAVGTTSGQQALLFYLAVYMFMNLTAFAVVLAVADSHGGETITDYAGLGYRSPFAAACLAITLFSLTGLPPFSGFVGKVLLFSAVIQRGLVGGGTVFFVLAVVGVANSVVSLYYYAGIIKAMYLGPAPPPDSHLALAPVHQAVLGILIVPTVLLGIYWSPLIQQVERALR